MNMKKHLSMDDVNSIMSKKFNSKRELLEYYRKVLPERVGEYHQEEVGPVMHHDKPGEAAKFLNGIFHLGQASVEMKDEIDWFAAPNGDLEWNGGLVRHGYFTLLAREYQETGDERYAEVVIEHMINYIERVPPFEPEGKPYLEYKKSTWRPFEVAARSAETWPEALSRVICSPAMTPERWLKILYSIHEHGKFLQKHHWRTGNHAALEVSALGILGIFYREFKEAEYWRSYSVENLMKLWKELFEDDGYTKEMSGGYNWVAIRSYFSLYEVAKNNGFEYMFPDAYTINC